MKSKLSYEKAKRYIEKLGYKLLTKEFKNVKTKLIICENEGYYYLTIIDRLFRNIFPDKFNKSNPYTIQNIRLWCKLNNKPFELVSTKYEGSHKKLQWKCLKENCGEIFENYWSNIFSLNQSCGVCYGRQVGISNCLAIKNTELAKEWHPTKNGDLTPYNVTDGSNKKVWWKCSKNPKHEWKAKISDRRKNQCPYCIKHTGGYTLPSEDYNLLITNPKLCEEWSYNKNKKLPQEYTPKSSQYVWWICREYGHEWRAMIGQRTGKSKTGCPQCNESKGEKRIRYYLNSNKIIYEREYNKFLGLLSNLGNPLRFDFAIFEDEEKTQLKMLIEYDGEFHYKKMYNGDNFEILKEHDKRKDIYCKENNIPLIRIPYWEFDNIEKILEEKLLDKYIKEDN